MPLDVLPLMLCVFSFTTGEFVAAGILPDMARDLGVSIPAVINCSSTKASIVATLIVSIPMIS